MARVAAKRSLLASMATRFAAVAGEGATVFRFLTHLVGTGASLGFLGSGGGMSGSFSKSSSLKKGEHTIRVIWRTEINDTYIP